MNIQVGDVLQMKKTHPCGQTCGREVMILRSKAEKSVEKILPQGREPQ